MRLTWLLLFSLVLIQGCSVTADRTAPAPVRDAAKPRPAPPPPPARKADEPEVYAYRAPAEPVFKPARPVLALVEKAEDQRSIGDLAGAAVTLERALRIERRNPHLWNRLAQVRLDQGDYAQAGSLAAKSNALAGDAPDLRRDNARIMAAADRARRR